MKTAILSSMLYAFLAAAPPAAAQVRCLADSQVRELVETQSVRPLSAALRSAGISGRIVSAKLCYEGRRAVYQVSVLSTDGRVRQVSVPAN